MVKKEKNQRKELRFWADEDLYQLLKKESLKTGIRLGDVIRMRLSGYEITKKQ